MRPAAPAWSMPTEKPAARWRSRASAPATLSWGAVHANLGAFRTPERHWRPAWGVAVESTWGAVTAHIEAFGERNGPPTYQTGALWEWTPGWQLDGIVGRRQGRTLLSLGIKHSF